MNDAWARWKAWEELSRAEAARVARELHDGPAQLLTALAFLSRAMERSLQTGTPPDAESVTQLAELVDQVSGDIRGVIRRLRAEVNERADLEQELRVLAQAASGASFHCSAKTEGKFISAPAPVRRQLVAFASDAIRWAARNGMSSAEITLTADPFALSVHCAGIAESAGPDDPDLRMVECRARILGDSLTRSRVAAGQTLACRVAGDLPRRVEAAGDGTGERRPGQSGNSHSR